MFEFLTTVTNLGDGLNPLSIIAKYNCRLNWVLILTNLR